MFRWADKLPDETKPPPSPPDPRNQMIKWFAFDHLPQRLQPVSAKFAELAMWMRENIARGPEATESMRKLLEAKDCAVRAFLDAEPTALKEPPPNIEDVARS
jgi:hypothetical protein